MIDTTPYQHITDHDIIAIAEAWEDQGSSSPCPSQMEVPHLEARLERVRSGLAASYPYTEPTWQAVKDLRAEREERRRKAELRKAAAKAALPVWRNPQDIAGLADGTPVWVATNRGVLQMTFQGSAPRFESAHHRYFVKDPALQGWAHCQTPVFTGVE